MVERKTGDLWLTALQGSLSMNSDFDIFPRDHAFSAEILLPMNCAASIRRECSSYPIIGIDRFRISHILLGSSRCFNARSSLSIELRTASYSLGGRQTTKT